MRHHMSSDPFQGLAPERSTTDSQKLLSLALDAYLGGYVQVAQDLTRLANELDQAGRCTRLAAVARVILARAKKPGQGFDTLLDQLDLSEVPVETLRNEFAGRDQ